MNNSEDPQRTNEVENIDHDNERVHLILLHVQVSEVDHLNVLFLIMSFVVVLQQPCEVMIIGLLREVKLEHETNDDRGVCAYGATFRVPLDFWRIVVLALYATHSLEIDETKEELD